MIRIIEELSFILSSLIVIFWDNKSTILMTKNLMFHGRRKEIELRYHFIRDQAISATIEVKFCSTKDQATDKLTKALNFASFMKFQGDVGVISFASRDSLGV